MLMPRERFAAECDVDLSLWMKRLTERIRNDELFSTEVQGRYLNLLAEKRPANLPLWQPMDAELRQHLLVAAAVLAEWDERMPRPKTEVM